jgi:hypothetical protein
VGADHGVEHEALAGFRSGHVAVRVELGGRLGQPGEQRCLGQRELRRRLAEVGFGRRLDPVRLVAVVDAIQIGLEDLVLRILVLDLDREDHLVELAKDGPVLRQVDVFDQLLRDRAPALVESEPEQVLQAGLPGAQQVQRAMLVEGSVFDRDRRLPHGGGDLAQGDDVPPLGSLVDLGQEHGAGTVVNPGRKRKPCRAQVGGGGKPGPDIEHGRQQDQQHGEDGRRCDHPRLEAHTPKATQGELSAALWAKAAISLQRVTAAGAIGRGWAGHISSNANGYR